MPPSRLNQSLLKPFEALAVPGMYLVYKYNQFKRQQQENSRRKVAEKELAHLNSKIVSKSDLAFSLTSCLLAKEARRGHACGHGVEGCMRGSMLTRGPSCTHWNPLGINWEHCGSLRYPLALLHTIAYHR